MMNLGAAPPVTPLGVTGRINWRGPALTAAIAAIVLAACASSVTVTGALVADDAGATPKLYHAGLLLAGAALALRGRMVRPRVELVAYFAVTIAATLLAYRNSDRIPALPSRVGMTRFAPSKTRSASSWLCISAPGQSP